MYEGVLTVYVLFLLLSLKLCATAYASSRLVRSSTPDSLNCNTTGEVRLVNGCDSLEGRVEVCANGEWGTVCDDRWDNVDAQVVCNQLGFTNFGAIFLREAFFGEGSGEIWLDEVACSGSEEELLECPASPLGTGNCEHFEDAGVRCYSPCVCDDVRLVGGENYFEGRVDVCSEGEFNTVTLCDDTWDDNDAKVICSKLGFFAQGHIALHNTSFNSSIDGLRLLENLSCSGDEATLRQCPSSPAVDMQNCSYFEFAVVRCATSDVTLVPFGLDVGDEQVTVEADDVISLGPFHLETPLVFYLQKKSRVYVSSNGVFSFVELNHTEATTVQQPSQAPLIATLWTTAPGEQEGSRSIFSRVAQDEATLDLVQSMVTEESADIRDFQPSLAVIITWKRSLGEILQVILSTDGRASFATFVLNDGEGLVALQNRTWLYFDAGDQLRSYSVPGPANLMSLQTMPKTFRIDGDCIASSEDACSMSGYTIGCVADYFACSCYHSLLNDQQNDATIMSSGSELGLGLESELGSGLESESGYGVCVPGSLPVRTASLLTCHPVLLPCLVTDTCPADATQLTCSTQLSDFTVFGGGVGDAVALPEHNDESYGPLNLTVPIRYFGQQHIQIYVSDNGYVTFDGPFSENIACSLPCADVPIIAPLWIDLNFQRFGLLYFRESQDPDILDRVRTMVTRANPDLIGYQPTQAVIVTWFQGMPVFTLTEYDTIQLVLSTDGKRSFAAFLYNTPQLISPFLTRPGDPNDFGIGTGFFGPRSTGEFGDVEAFLLDHGLPLPSLSQYRIDGQCITSVSPGEVCPLVSTASECESFAATSCLCDEGFTAQGIECIDIDECSDPTICDEEAECINSNGSFTCVCKPGFTGDGFACVEAKTNQLPTLLPAILVPCLLVVLFLLATVTLVVVGIKKRHRTLVQGLRTKVTDSLENENGHRHSNEYFERLRLMSVQSSFDLKISKAFLVNSCNLKIGATIGHGEFGIVYKASLRRSFTEQYSDTVAVKTLKGFMEKELVTKLLKECAKMKELDHPNVLTLRGVCLDGGPAPYIIMPFMANGSLLSHLKSNRETLVVEPDSSDEEIIVEVRKKLLDMCIQVAKGMEYLASKKLIHRDLAARNCMIDTGFIIKVADFGLAESMESKEYFRQTQGEVVKLPLKWLAPESIDDGIFSEKTDVWAYGVTCWEIFSGGKSPYAGIHPMEIAKKLEQGYRMDKPLNAACLDEMFSIVKRCWEQKAENRPHFSQVVSQLAHFLGSLAEYFDLMIGATVTANPLAIVLEQEEEEEQEESQPSQSKSADAVFEP